MKLIRLAQKGHKGTRMTEMMPRFDGVYMAPGNGSSSYIRFHPGGSVSVISAVASPSDVFDWLTPNDPDASQGSYSVRDEQLYFTVSSQQGQVTYDGQVRGDNVTELHLHISSEINDSQRDAIYVFAGSTSRSASRMRFSVEGKPGGRLYAGPHVKNIDWEFWPVINFSVTDGKETVSVDCPIEAASAIIVEMQRIINEYGDGSDIPNNWDFH